MQNGTIFRKFCHLLTTEIICPHEIIYHPPVLPHCRQAMKGPGIVYKTVIVRTTPQDTPIRFSACWGKTTHSPQHSPREVTVCVHPPCSLSSIRRPLPLVHQDAKVPTASIVTVWVCHMPFILELCATHARLRPRGVRTCRHKRVKIEIVGRATTPPTIFGLVHPWTTLKYRLQQMSVNYWWGTYHSGWPRRRRRAFSLILEPQRSYPCHREGRWCVHVTQVN